MKRIFSSFASNCTRKPVTNVITLLGLTISSALAGLIALGVALLTVSWQSWWAEKRSLVETLRYE